MQVTQADAYMYVAISLYKEVTAWDAGVHRNGISNNTSEILYIFLLYISVYVTNASHADVAILLGNTKMEPGARG